MGTDGNLEGKNGMIIITTMKKHPERDANTARWL